MNAAQLAWFLWIPGTILIVLSWVNVVTPLVGWIGFGIALVGFAIGQFAGSRTGSGE